MSPNVGPHSFPQAPSAAAFEEDAWAKANQHLEKRHQEPRLVGRLFKAAAERTLSVTVMGEAIDCFWPGDDMMERMLAVYEETYAVLQASDDPATADPARIRSTIATQRKAMLRLAAEITKDESITEEALDKNPHGTRIASLIVAAVLSRVKDQREAVASFR